MADISPPAGLLDRAGHVFSLAWQLGRAFHDEHQRQREQHQVDATAWARHQPAFNEYYNALVALSDSIQNPPDGFSSVGESLRKAASAAKQIRDVMQTTEGKTWQEFLNFWPHLNSVAASGEQAISAVVKARRLDDPFAFVERPTTSNEAGIDTMPTPPKPPARLIEEAARAIPGILADVPPKHDGTVELVAAILAKRLQDAGHTLAAAQWAIHEAVKAERLRVGLVNARAPFVQTPNTSWGGPAFLYHRPQSGTKVIARGKPVPFGSFKVIATEALWAWWRSFDAAELGEDRSPTASSENPSEATPAVTAQADRRLEKHRIATDSPEVRVDCPDPLATLEQIIITLAACVYPLRTLLLESYGAAEERWRQARQDADGTLPLAVSRVRRWFATNLPPAFHLPAEQELAAAEQSVNQLLTCPVPQPALPIGWHEDEDGKQHTPVGGSDPRHREACQRQKQAAATAMQAVSRLTRWRDWETRGSDSEHRVNPNAVSAPKGKRSTERGDGRTKLISRLTKHHNFAEGSCLNLEPINNNELARLAEVDKATASAFFKKEFGGHAKYKVLCRDAARLAASLKFLNDEYTPRELFGRNLPGEDDQDDGV